MKIFMIRHCEAQDDVLDCYGGCADWELTENGANTAKKYAEKLLSFGIDKIFSSPYKRAIGVAKIFADKTGCDIEIIDGVKEFNTYGVLSGVNKKLAKELFAQILNSDEYKSYGYYKGKSFYGGESVIDFDKRVQDSFNYIVSQKHDTVAIVTHGKVFQSVYKNILNGTDEIDATDCGTIEIEYDGNNFNMIGMTGIKVG